MLIERIEIRLLDLPLREPFVAAHGTTSSREIVVVRIEGDSGYGWGECSALPEPTYTEEFAAGAFDLLEEELAPRLLGHRLEATSIRSRLSVVAANPMAKAALEMALLDAELRASDRSLADWLGATNTRVAAGAAIGLGSVDEVTERAAALAAEGFGRLKLKITPGHDLDVVAAVRGAVPEVEIQVDGNGSYREEHLGLLTELSSSGVSAIEQPFAVAATALAARLCDVSPIPIVADEAASSITAVEVLRSASAVGGVSIKPPRVGGLLAARDFHDACASWSLPATAGGMIEAGLGRHALVAVAALPAFSLTGDVSPAGRWLAADPWPDLSMADGTIEVPSGPGVSSDPDPDRLAHHTSKQVDLRIGNQRA